MFARMSFGGTRFFAICPYNLTISNVPGPRLPLHVAGARVRSIYPVIPIPERHALAIGVLTYDDHAHFGFYCDPQALPRVGRLPVIFEEAVAELELTSGRAGPTRPRSRARAPLPPARAGS